MRTTINMYDNNNNKFSGKFIKGKVILNYQNLFKPYVYNTSRSQKSCAVEISLKSDSDNINMINAAIEKVKHLGIERFEDSIRTSNTPRLSIQDEDDGTTGGHSEKNTSVV